MTRTNNSKIDPLVAGLSKLPRPDVICIYDSFENGLG